MRNIYVLVLSIFFLTGCSLSPELKTPIFEEPLVFDNNTSIDLTKYWEKFDDENLNRYIDELLSKNYYLNEAILRVEQARANLQIANSELYPSLSINANGTKNQTSSESYPNVPRANFKSFSLSSILNYELDLWGRVANTKEAAKSRLIAKEAQKDAVKLSLIATLVESYFNIISLQNQLDIAKKTLKTREGEVLYRQKQFSAGVVDELVIFGAKVQVGNAKLILENLQKSLELATSAFKTLLGATPKEYFDLEIKTNKNLPELKNRPIKLPSNLIERRADIKSALEELKATNALIGVAKSAYFPTISLSGALGFASSDLGNLISSDANIWNFGGSIGMPLFNFGKTEANIESTEAQKKIAFLRYEKSIKEAFREVYDALVLLESAIENLKNSKTQTELLEKSYELIRKRYESGYTTYLELLDIERALFSSNLESIKYRQNILASTITLYKALGGGWGE